MMSQNVNTAKSKSFLKWEDWLVVRTGGMVSCGALGWLVYRDFKSRQFGLKGIMTIAASFVGGLGLYFTGSALIYMWENFNDSLEKLTSLQDASYLDALDREVNICDEFVNLSFELERKFSFEASKTGESKGFKKSIMHNIESAAEVPLMAEDATNRQNGSNCKRLRNGLNLPTSNRMETSSNESSEDPNVRFKEEILSYVSDLKCYVHGAIEALPSARHINFLSTETRDEMYRLVIMRIKKYVDSMIPKFTQVIDEFVDSTCETTEVIDCNKEHREEEPVEIWGFSEKGSSTPPLKMTMTEFYKKLNEAIKYTLELPPEENDESSTLEACMESPKPTSIPTLHEENTCVKTSDSSLSEMLASPSSTRISYLSKEANRPGPLAVEKNMKPHSEKPVKLSLNEEQMNYLNILKSEI